MGKKKRKNPAKPKLSRRDKALYSAVILAPIILFAVLIFIYISYKNDAIFSDANIIAYD